jgi:hypothetical protein
MVRDHDEIYDELMEKKQSEEREKLDTTGDASVGKSKYRLPKKSVDEGVETLKPTEPSRKAKPVVKIAKAGGLMTASKRADGCAQRGKTRGKMV